MILFNDKIRKAQDRIVDRMNAGTLSAEAGSRQILDLDPYDDHALMALGLAAEQEGRQQEAEQCYWRAVEANPCGFQCYLALSNVIGRQQGFEGAGDALMDLALQKILANQAFLEQFRAHRPADTNTKLDPGDRAVLQLHLTARARQREAEAQSVTDRMRPHRLIHEVQYPPASGLSREVVDRILEYGSACGPLLVGVLRGWRQQMLPAGDDLPAAASLALLGEIGDPAALPAVLEFTIVEEDMVRVAAGWAACRIAGKHSSQAVAAIREVGSHGPPELRFGLAETLGWLPGIEGVGESLTGLLDDLAQVPVQMRGDLFLLVASALENTLGERGWEMTLAAFDRNAPLLGSKIKKLTDAMRREPWKGQRHPDLPEFLGKSVYELCGEGAEEPVEERLRVKPSRNAPCWCGSGKKYKKCHLAADESAGTGVGRPELVPEGGEIAQLRGRLVAFVQRELTPTEQKQAVSLFFGPTPRQPESGDDPSIALMEWLVFDYVPPRLGRPMIVEFLERNREQLSSPVRRTLETWQYAHCRLLEVERVEPGIGVELRDLLTGGAWFVHDVSSSNTLAQWDVLLSRLVDCEGRAEFAADGLVVPRPLCEPLQKWIAADRKKQGLDWPEYLRANSHRLRLQVFELVDKRPLPKIVSAEGDPLVFSKAVYEVLDEAALQAGLQQSEVIEETEAGHFVWLETPGTGSRILGSLHLQGNRLTLECSSRQRLERGQPMIESLAGAALRRLGSSFTGVESALREARSSPAHKPGPAIPPEVEQQIVGKFLEDHYRNWPDQPLPALGGKTPREAMRTRQGRQRVIDLLKHLENSEDRNRRAGKPSYDFSKVKAALGIDTLLE